jgi:hypothetical protein
MTIGEKLSQGAVEVQEAWTRLSDTWMQSAQDLVGTVASDPFGLLHPDVILDQLLDLTRRSVEINLDLIGKLTGAPLPKQTPKPVEITATVRELEPPAEKAPTAPVAAAKYTRVSKAELQRALSSRHLPKTGTVKELRQRLIEADRTAAG